MEERPLPTPGPGELLLRIEACGVCRTDLHVVDGELTQPRLPIVPGHEIVGRVVAAGPGVTGVARGSRVGVPWLGHACGHCPYCASARENLCDDPLFTGYTRDGGYATHVIADAAYSFPLAEGADAATLAPLLCAGLIGWRTLKMAGPAQSVGIYGAPPRISSRRLRSGKEDASTLLCGLATARRRSLRVRSGPLRRRTRPGRRRRRSTPP